MSAAYDELISLLRNASLLGSCASVLGWDEQTNLPPRGAEHRANQLGLLAGMIHEQNTQPRIEDLLAELEQDSRYTQGNSPETANVREARKNYDRATKLPKRLVEELSRVSTLGQQAWVQARREKDFPQFQPWLEQIIALKREEAEAVGYGDGVPYDALLDEYEPGARSAAVQAVFTPLREELVQLLTEIRATDYQPNIDILTRRYPVAVQKQFGMEAAAKIGFDFDAGRLDVAAHPFCSGFGPGDCRLTTRYDENFFPGAFFGTLHEAGHGIYEQGLKQEAFGTAMGHACSLGIHESQSRMWENFVGRSKSFWNHFWPKAKEAFPEALGGESLDEFYKAINDVRSSFIRVEADEVTYNLHIMLRFELEQLLLTGELEPVDVPVAWNERFISYFGIIPPDASQGCLQDIHWSGGLVGYFPTYALGNMYAAQLYNAAEAELGDLDLLFAAGEFQPLKEWLNRNIHERGHQYAPPDLVKVVTGQPLSHQPLVRHLREKFSEVYGL